MLIIGITVIFLIVSSTTVFAQEFLDETTTSVIESVTKLYKIKKGDTLWRISKLHNVPIEELMAANDLKGDLIITGSMLKIPKEYYVVQDNSNPSEIARVPASHIVAVETSSMVAANTKGKVTISSLVTRQADDNNRYWLAKIIEAEAGIETLKGKIAVGAVVLNRVEDDWFPDTIKDVIFQKYQGVYQFSPVGDKRIYKVEPSEEAYEAADRALMGEDPTEGALYFYNPSISKSRFFAKKDPVATIGNHQFFE